jgi:hypothetical protein
MEDLEETEADDELEVERKAGAKFARLFLGPAGVVLLILFGAWLVIWVRR